LILLFGYLSDTSGAGTAYRSGAHEFIPGF